MNRTDRQYAILSVLWVRKKDTIANLAVEFGVSIRTIGVVFIRKPAQEQLQFFDAELVVLDGMRGVAAPFLCGEKFLCDGGKGESGGG